MPNHASTRTAGAGRDAPLSAAARVGVASVALWGVLAMSGPDGARAAEAPGSTPAFRRGFSVHELLNWGNLRPGDPGRYTDTPFTGPHHLVPDELLRNAARAGFDFVRLTVDPGPYLQLTGRPRAALDEALTGEVARLRGFGFAVLVDLHPVEQVPLYGRGMALAEAHPGMDEYRGLVARTARLLGALRTRSVGLEIMNEPDGYDPASEARWRTVLEDLHAAARAAAPDLLLVLSGAEGGDAGGLEHLDARLFADPDVMYTFHYYEPHAFTHQGVPGDDVRNDVRPYLAGLPYPSTFPFDPASLVARNIAADPAVDPARRRRLAERAEAAAAAYAAGGFDRDRVRRDFDRVAGWAKAQGVPETRILLGEFSVARQSDDHVGADPLSAEGWLHDVRREAEDHGFGWAYWGLAGASPMQLTVDDGATTLDPGVLSALGLPATARR